MSATGQMARGSDSSPLSYSAASVANQGGTDTSNDQSTGEPAPSPAPEEVPPGERGWRARGGCLAYAVLAVGVMSLIEYVVFALLLSRAFGPDCGALDLSQASDEATATLDVQHPFVEQRVVLTINSTALPADLPADAITLQVQAHLPGLTPSPIPSAVASASASESLEPMSSGVQVTFVRDGINLVAGRIGTPEAATRSPSLSAATIGIDCPRLAACERAYRVVIALVDSSAGSTTISWTVRGTVKYEKSHGPCGPPSDSRASVRANPPALGDRSQIVSVRDGSNVESGVGLVIARHVTIETNELGGEGATPSVANVRFAIHQLADAYRPWRIWARVLADDDGRILADGPLTDAFAGRESTIDVPVLAGCRAAGSCRRGYWLVLQSFPYAPPFSKPLTGSGADPGPPGPFAWTVEGTARAAAGTRPPGTLTITVDDRVDGLGQPVVESEPIAMTLEGGVSSRSIPITFSVDRMPATGDGPDRLAASIAIVHVEARGSGFVTRVEGDGTGSLSSYVNGQGSANLVAHPFDGCRAGAPCRVGMRLVAAFLPPASSVATMTWSISLLGAPPGVSIAVGDPIDESRLPSPGSVDLRDFAIVAILIVVLLIVDVARSRSRRQQPAP